MPPIGEQKPFAERMGFANRPARPSNEGVVADWNVLPADTRAFRQGWTYLGSKKSPRTELGGGGTAIWNYAWKEDPDRTLSVQVFVFNEGQSGAVAKMDRAGNASNMYVKPFGPAPDAMRLGDWTAMPYPEQAAKRRRSHSIFWVFRNVFAQVRMTDGEGVNALPIARVIQGFMEKHKTDDLQVHLPKVSELRIAPERVSVGGAFRADVLGSKNANLRVSVSAVEGEVERKSDDGPISTWEAVEPGRAVLEAVILDEKTLLSASTRASVEVVPVSQ